MNIAGSSRVEFELKSHRKRSEVHYEDPISLAQFIRTALKMNDEGSSSLRFPADFPQLINLLEILFCSAKIGRRPDNGQSLIVDTIEPLLGANIGDLKKGVRDSLSCGTSWSITSPQ
jgi:hypothetical protein